MKISSLHFYERMRDGEIIVYADRFPPHIHAMESVLGDETVPYVMREGEKLHIACANGAATYEIEGPPDEWGKVLAHRKKSTWRPWR